MEAKRSLFIPQIQKIEAERTRLIPEIGKIEAKKRTGSKLCPEGFLLLPFND